METTSYEIRVLGTHTPAARTYAELISVHVLRVSK